MYINTTDDNSIVKQLLDGEIAGNLDYEE